MIIKLPIKPTSYWGLMFSKFRINIIIVFFSMVFLSCCKEEYKGVVFEKDRVYILFRESNSKVGKIVKSYNAYKTEYTHVGLGVFINNKFQVIHILPNDIVNEKNGLLKESVKSFFEPIDDAVSSGQIMESIQIDEANYRRILNKVKELEAKKIKFDFQFMTDKDNKFYCSELVCYILSSTNQFSFKEHRKKLTSFEASYLKRDSLIYFPADIFIGHSDFLTKKKW